MSAQSVFKGLYLFVRDLSASTAFYRRLGLIVESVGDDFARAELGNGLSIEFGTAALTRRYDPSRQEPSGPGTNTLNFMLPSSDAVDATYVDLTLAGYGAQRRSTPSGVRASPSLTTPTATSWVFTVLACRREEKRRSGVRRESATMRAMS